jgi:hypothetical protein
MALLTLFNPRYAQLRDKTRTEGEKKQLLEHKKKKEEEKTRTGYTDCLMDLSIDH